MEIHTVDRGFIKQEEIDEFESLLWAERYYGDGDFKLVVPATENTIAILPKGQLLMMNGSNVPMILETREIKEGNLETTGISLTQWLNNRIIRTSPDHSVKEWVLPGFPPGEVLTYIVQQMCIGSSYLTGYDPIGIPSSRTTLWPVPGLQIGATDISPGPDGPTVDVTVPFGPVYDALKAIATTYEVGMKIVLDGAYDDYYILSYISYKGADRTSTQSVNPTIRFSAEMDSFTNISDLESITDHKNSVYIFSDIADPAIAPTAGFAATLPVTTTGFDLRVSMGYADNVPSDVDAPGLLKILNQQALKEAQNRKVVQLVDGEIVQVEDVVFGTNFFLGDVVEVEGNTGVLQKARITEYIRSQDSAGERSYPTLAMID